MVKAFLSQYPAPIALVAHNGNEFDFPILRRHLVNNQENIILCFQVISHSIFVPQGYSLGADIFTVDTLPIFRAFEGKGRFDAGFKLRQIYERYTKKDPIDLYTAEGHCLQLLECCIAVKRKFILIADEQKVSFDQTNDDNF